MTTLPNGVRVRTDLSDLSDLEPTMADDQQVQPYRWTSDGHLHTDPNGMAPLTGEPSPEDYDTAATSTAWATGTGKKVTLNPIADPEQLAAMARVASKNVALQSDENLLKAMTPDELAEARALARGQREQTRAHDNAMAQFELDEEAAQARHEQAMASRRRAYREQVAAARERQQRAADPSHRLVLLTRLATWLPLAALLPALFAVVVGAFNAASELNRINPETQWVNWLLEPMFSVGVLVILVAQWLGAVPSVMQSLHTAQAAVGGMAAKARAAASNGFVVAELLLFALTVLLQVGVHYVGPDADRGLAPVVWFFVPLGLLISMILVPAVSTRINEALSVALQAAETVPATEPAPVPEVSGTGGNAPVPAEGDTTVDLQSERVGNGAGNTVPTAEPAPVPAASTSTPPRGRTWEELVAAFRDAITAGTVNPTSQRNVRETLRCSRDRARELVALYASENPTA